MAYRIRMVMFLAIVICARGTLADAQKSRSPAPDVRRISGAALAALPADAVVQFEGRSLTKAKFVTEVKRRAAKARSQKRPGPENSTVTLDARRLCRPGPRPEDHETRFHDSIGYGSTYMTCPRPPDTWGATHHGKDGVSDADIAEAFPYVCGATGPKDGVGYHAELYVIGPTGVSY